MNLIFSLFKLRIGVVIALTAVAGLAVTPGPYPGAWQAVVLALAVLVSSAAAGAFNQYVERDIDARMRRTRGRPFPSGRLIHGPRWLVMIVAMVFAAVAAAAYSANLLAALYVFLGAFFYAVVYTVWLKRRTWLNIVVGGLSGSFAVLAGAAAAGPAIHPAALSLAFVLFLWTPPHFWSLAIAHRRDYEAAGVPMLPVVIGDRRCARVILGNSALLVAASLLPVLYGMGYVYLAAALAGGGWLLFKSWHLLADPCPRTAMGSFHASLIQLGVLLLAALVDRAIGG